ncbi:probable HTH-type transcriptional regulator LeuO [Salmonella enterica subsp. enterica]|uniref:Probable HTH-type transcriptional regulator LeuO n=1 Tax=Salmonella enterica I TaxID=59201 RepID=A0A447MY32_SALET|nr:probable HTH-type transcriptional regulator LeuO [Salmonella enterica subsp. enterica]
MFIMNNMRLFLSIVYASFSQPWYDTPDKQSSVAYQGMALISVLNVVSQTHLVAIAPRWLAEEFAESLDLQILPLPLKLNSRTCYLSWHEAAGRDKGHQWMEDLLVSVCKAIKPGQNKSETNSGLFCFLAYIKNFMLN